MMGTTWVINPVEYNKHDRQLSLPGEESYAINFDLTLTTHMTQKIYI